LIYTVNYSVYATQFVSQFASTHASRYQSIFQSIFQWAEKEMLILDEMVSLLALQEIENKLRAVRDTGSEEAFGGLKVVLFCGDFFQFPPVLGRALWQAVPHTDEVSATAESKRLWASFRRLNEQIHQQMIWNIMHYYAESGLVPLQYNG